jgi:hypothetical protein
LTCFGVSHFYMSRLYSINTELLYIHLRRVIVRFDRRCLRHVYIL